MPSLTAMAPTPEAVLVIPFIGFPAYAFIG
jgi:hypothetical protein